MSQRPQSEKTASAQSSVTSEPTDESAAETPMYAVWLALGVIVAAGLYGIHLGTEARSKPKTDEQPTSSHLFQVTPRGKSEIGWHYS